VVRTEFSYEILPGEIHPKDGVLRFENIATWSIEQRATFYCEDPECERTHEDPTKLWDSRTWSTLGDVIRFRDAVRVAAALARTEGPAPKPSSVTDHDYAGADDGVACQHCLGCSKPDENEDVKCRGLKLCLQARERHVRAVRS
jgi:hypothetical protein